MKPRFIFCGAVCLALLAVILLALLSPVSHTKHSKDSKEKPRLADLSLYIQQPQSTANSKPNKQAERQSDSGVFVFRRMLTEGPENTSRIVGKAQGFIIPNEDFAQSPFNIIYLCFDSPTYTGSLSVHASHISHDNRDELAVVGGTGSFAFAQGIAIFVQTDSDRKLSDTYATYHLKLQLQLPKG